VSDLFVRAVSAVRVNRVMIDTREVRKERRLGAGLVIAAGNVYFRLAGALFRMFPSLSAWVAHETDMFHRLHGLSVRRDGRAIVMPRLPGRDLLAIVQDDPEATGPLEVAGRAVRALHQAGLSHGDLNLGNLIVDGGVARAIDFDAAHLGHPLLLRCADDLLGLVLDLARLDGDTERRLAHLLAGYGAATHLAPAFRVLSQPRGFLGRSLLRARAHGATELQLGHHLDGAATLLETSGR